VRSINFFHITGNPTSGHETNAFAYSDTVKNWLIRLYRFEPFLDWFKANRTFKHTLYSFFKQYTMSAIDCYKHELLGFIICPSTYDFVSFSNTREIAIYKLLQSIPEDEDDFDGLSGDILVGGGGGEAPALRISNPKAFDFFASEDFENVEFTTRDDLYKAFWRLNTAFIFCEGYLKLGWEPSWDIESWLAENVCRVLIDSFDEFARYRTHPKNVKGTLSFTPSTNGPGSGIL
jgi:hypothetical protein